MNVQDSDSCRKQAWSNPFSRVAKISALLVGEKRLPETSIVLFQSTPSFGEEPLFIKKML